MSNTASVSISNTIYHYLREQISSLSLKPGEKLSEAKLARQFACSRVPVREAVGRLVTEKALEIFPQRGSFVTLIDMEEAEHSRFLREVLETYIVLDDFDKNLLTPLIPYFRSLISRQQQYLNIEDYQHAFELDSEFHRIFYTIGGKEFALAHTGDFEIHYFRARLLGIMLEQEHTMVSQHTQIVDAIEGRNREALSRFLISHYTNVSNVLGQVPKPFDSYIRR